MTEAINPSYEDIQRQAKGPGVEEWKSADKARASLPEFYRERGSATKPSEPRWKRSTPRRRSCLSALPVLPRGRAYPCPTASLS